MQVEKKARIEDGRWRMVKKSAIDAPASDSSLLPLFASVLPQKNTGIAKKEIQRSGNRQGNERQGNGGRRRKFDEESRYFIISDSRKETSFLIPCATDD